MSDVSMKANVQFTPRGDLGRFVASRVTPAAMQGVEAATKILFDETQVNVPVRAGELKASGKMDVHDTGKSVVGTVYYTAAHAQFVETGTGQRGAASPGASDKVSYSPTWPGMAAQPYLRNSLDSVREQIRQSMASQMSASFKI